MRNCGAQPKKPTEPGNNQDEPTSHLNQDYNFQEAPPKNQAVFFIAELWYTLRHGHAAVGNQTLYSSVRPALISRPHLIGRRNEGRHRKLTLISAPTGFGKTTLVSDWLRQIDLSAAWLSLDEGDNDLTRFLNYLICALGTVQSEIQVAVQMLLQAPQSPPLETTMTMLINRLATVPVQFVVVLDDYHVIKQQSIHQALAFLLDHVPPQLHLVITSRADPPRPLSRWRGGGQLAELREPDLRFLLEETATFWKIILSAEAFRLTTYLRCPQSGLRERHFLGRFFFYGW